MYRFALLLLLAPGSPAYSQAVASWLRFEHQDWEIACDNTRTCRAVGYQSDALDEAPPLPVSLLLERAGGAGSQVRAQLALATFDDDDVPPKTASLRLDGRNLGVLAFSSRDGTAPLSARQVQTLLPALIGDSEISVVAPDRTRWWLSDRGAAAVLLKMDEFQGRLGTPGALVRRGQRDESTVPPAVLAPIVRIPRLPPSDAADERLAEAPGLRQALRSSLAADQFCDGLDEAGQSKSLGVVARLSDRLRLVSVPCWTGAYNGGEGYWVVATSEPWMPVLVTLDGNGYESGLISATHKARGIGDCWSTTEWAWDGVRFIESKNASTGMCRGFPGGAWLLPTLTTDVRR